MAKNFTPREKLYGLVLRDCTGTYFGYVDASLTSMGWSSSSIMLRDEEWCLWYRDHLRKSIQAKYRGSELFIVRIHSRTCPIDVNYNVRSPRPRNHAFTVKIHM